MRDVGDAISVLAGGRAGGERGASDESFVVARRRASFLLGIFPSERTTPRLASLRLDAEPWTARAVAIVPVAFFPFFLLLLLLLSAPVRANGDPGGRSALAMAFFAMSHFPLCF